MQETARRLLCREGHALGDLKQMNQTSERNEVTSTKQNPDATKREMVEFQAMNLQVESRLQLLMHRGLTPVQHFSTLIGYMKDEYLLIKMPVENGAPLLLREGELLTIRVFSGMTVCSFDATVMRAFFHPFFYAHLTFPKVIQGASLRGAMRIKVNMPAEVKTTGSDGTPSNAPVSLGNLSVTGALVESDKPLGEKGDVLHLSFAITTQFDDHEVRVEVRATIQNAQHKPSAGGQPEKFIYGVQFDELDATHKIMLQNLIYQALVEDRQKLL
jgi:c-di-GMP-binding flagellar brake protein YcgR